MSLSKPTKSEYPEVEIGRTYTKLNRYQEYDKEAAEELAAALNELRKVEARATELRVMVEENNDLSPFIWTTAQGVSVALHDITEDHFKAILQYIVDRGTPITKSILAEAQRRNIAIPSTTDRIYPYRRIQAAVSDNEDFDDPDF